MTLKADSPPNFHRLVREAIESDKPETAVAIIENLLRHDELFEAKVLQKGPLLFMMGVALLKQGKHKDAERRLLEAVDSGEGAVQLAEVWALIGDARAAQLKPVEAAEAYANAVRSGGSGDASIVRYASARREEIDAANLLEKGDAISAVKKLFEAAKISEERLVPVRTQLGEIAGNRKLRGEATAAAVFFLGELEYQAGNLPEAIAYYQRVFVAWLKYPAWVARSYLRAAECFYLLGKREEAVAHLREMLRKADRLKGQPELEEARRTLAEWTSKKP